MSSKAGEEAEPAWAPRGACARGRARGLDACAARALPAGSGARWRRWGLHRRLSEGTPRDGDPVPAPRESRGRAPGARWPRWWPSGKGRRSSARPPCEATPRSWITAAPRCRRCQGPRPASSASPASTASSSTCSPPSCSPCCSSSRRAGGGTSTLSPGGPSSRAAWSEASSPTCCSGRSSTAWCTSTDAGRGAPALGEKQTVTACRPTSCLSGWIYCLFCNVIT